MNHFLHGVARATIEAFDLPEPILEIGSYQVAGQQDLIDLRSLFSGKDYVGVDIRPGPGVDVVASVESLPYADASIGAVVALSTFEHVQRFWKGFAELKRVLRPDGVLVVACPFHFHIHNHPNDYWRFTPEAFNFLLEDYPFRIIGCHGPAKRPANVWAVAFQQDREPPDQQGIDNYRRLLTRYAKEPLAFGKALRYRLGRVLCGKRPFDYYLHQNRWTIQCRTSQVQSSTASNHSRRPPRIVCNEHSPSR